MASNISELVGQEAPITSFAEDKLNRSVVSNLLLKHIENTSPAYSEVIAIRGAWGSGKSSILNLAENSNQSSDIKILRFNPWYFHSIENIIQQYFETLAKFLEENGQDKKSIPSQLRKYGQRLARINTSGVEVLIGGRATWLLQRLQKSVRKEESLEAIKNGLKEDISKLNYKIAVFIDDLDRLSKEEILIVFKLVKLLADFENITYVVAIDFSQVNSMLSLRPKEAPKYLEKIFSSIIEVPELPPELLKSFTISEFGRILSGTDYEKRIDQKHWEKVYSEVIQPIVKTPRDVKRICQNLFYSFHVEKLLVNTVDIIAMETIRVIKPEVFHEIFRNAGYLTSHHNYGFSTQGNNFHPLIESFSVDPDWTNNLIGSMFQFGNQYIGKPSYTREFESTWIRERRVATRRILDYYQTKTEDDGLKLQLLAEKVAQLEDSDLIAEQIQKLNSHEIETVLELLLPMAKDGIIAKSDELLLGVFRVYPKLKKREPESILDLGPYLAVRRLVVAVLQQIVQKDQFAKTLFPRISNLLARIHFVEVIGNIPNVGQGFISSEVDKELSRQISSELSSLQDSSFISLGSPMEVLTLNAQLNQTWVCTQVNPFNPIVAEVIFKDSVSYGYRQEMGSGSGEVMRVLNWAGLRHIYGEDSSIQKAFDGLENLDEELQAIKKLIDDGEQKGFLDIPDN